MSASNGNSNSDGSTSASSSMSDNMEKIQRMRNELHKDTNSNSNDNHNHNHNPWDNLWEKEMTPWDIGSTTPVLHSELKRIRMRISSGSGSSMPLSPPPPSLRSLIPGCGGGYDLWTVAKHHQELLLSSPTSSSSSSNEMIESTVVGLDISPTSLKRATYNVKSLMLQEEKGDKEKDDKEKEDKEEDKKTSTSFSSSSSITTTDINFMCGDFFASESEWSSLYVYNTKTKYSSPGTCSNSNSKSNSNSNTKSIKSAELVESSAVQNANTRRTAGKKFDFIFDYTFFCALPVELRPKWGKRISTLLRPESGRLLTLIFPIPNESSSSSSSSSSPLPTPTLLDGPPFPVTVEDYRSVLEPHGFEMVDGSPFEHEDTIKPRKGKELVCWWKLIDTGTDTSTDTSTEENQTSKL